MSLVTRVSVAFLVALRWPSAGSPRPCTTSPGCACGSRSTRSWRRRWTLPGTRRGRERPRDLGHLRRDGAEDREPPGSGRPMILDGRDLGPLAVDVATTIKGPDGLRWRVLARPIGGRTTAGAGRPRPAAGNIARGRRTRRSRRPRALPRSPALTCWPRGPRSSRWSPRSDRWRPPCRCSRSASGRWPRGSAVISADAPSPH